MIETVDSSAGILRTAREKKTVRVDSITVIALNFVSE